MKKQILLISITACIILSLSSCGDTGYETGKRRGIEDAESYAKEKYEPEVTALEKELQKIKRDYEKRIVTMNKGHAAKIDEMNSTHASSINAMEAEHAAQINRMENAHNRELDNTRKSSYGSGQADMEKRIGEMIDLDVTNKPLGDDWNDTVYSVREK
jgi:Skp family chaperone for outer membrane proteins